MTDDDSDLADHVKQIRNTIRALQGLPPIPDEGEADE